LDDNTTINKLIQKFKEEFSIMEEKFENKIQNIQEEIINIKK